MKLQNFPQHYSCETDVKKDFTKKHCNITFALILKFVSDSTYLTTSNIYCLASLNSGPSEWPASF